MVDYPDKPTPKSKSNLPIPGGPLDKAFIVFHRMIMTMDNAEPSVKVCLLAYDDNDKLTGNAIMVSNLKTPQEVEALLKEGLNSAVMQRVLRERIVK